MCEEGVILSEAKDLGSPHMNVRVASMFREYSTHLAISAARAKEIGGQEWFARPRCLWEKDERHKEHVVNQQPSPSAAPAPLTPPQGAALLRAGLMAMQALVANSPREFLVWQPAPGEWCVLEVIGHLVETEERGFGGRIHALMAEERPQFSGWDPDGVAAARADATRDPADVVAEFTARREANIALLEGLPPEILERGGNHPQVGYLTGGDLLQEWVFHDGNHIRQMLANLQAYTWPHMGNAQRFSEGG